ncbi:MAG: helix-turn-helix transcriptional regulator [Clostridiaceae bacterium]|jgi:YesN/AraC family two-component response regulator|nr:helix-turn-helix transcriptional regulator [Clostridiaceae bacterium]
MQIMLPVNVMWISKIKYDNMILDKHTHDFYHMFYVKGGDGRMYVSDKEYTICENEVYFCPPGTYHGLTAQGDNPLNVIEVKFTVSDVDFDKVLASMQNRIKCRSSNLYLKLEELVIEALGKSMFYRQIVNSGFTRLLLELIRNKEQLSSTIVYNFEEKVANKINTNEGNSFVIKQVLQYINSKYAETITLKELAKAGAVSMTHLNKIFKEAFNISPMQYTNNFRLEKAKELMMYSDFNISQISELVGFSSIHYFSRYFKKRENISPSEYRSNVKNNIYIYL